MEDAELSEFGIVESAEPPPKKPRHQKGGANVCSARSTSANDGGRSGQGPGGGPGGADRSGPSVERTSGNGGCGGDFGSHSIRSLVGARVCKWFGAYGIYGGTVLACKSPERDEVEGAEREWYTVEYDDGDTEDLFREQVEQILLLESVPGQRGDKQLGAAGGRNPAHRRLRAIPPLRAGTRIWFRFNQGPAGGFITQPVKGRQGALGWAQVSFDDCTKLIVKLDPLTQGAAWDMTAWSDTVSM